jgi:hemoglobin/transferrin/lactoferrin receptor protein
MVNDQWRMDNLAVLTAAVAAQFSLVQPVCRLNDCGGNGNWTGRIQAIGSSSLYIVVPSSRFKGELIQMLQANRDRRTRLAAGWAVCFVLCSLCALVCGQAPEPRHQVTDESGEPLKGVRVVLSNAQGTVWLDVVTAADGTFQLTSLPRGTYAADIEAAGFQPQRLSLRLGTAEPLQIVLKPAALRDAVTVTARRGAVEDAASAAFLVSARSEDDWHARPLPTLGHALENSPGVLVQQSTNAQVSPFLRGLTGYQVLNLVDGVRFNNATFRSGPNQYLAFIEPSQAQRIEALLGPAGVQYGSDALGGTINVLTAAPRFNRQGSSFHGAAQTLAASAEAGGGANLKLLLSAPRVALLLGGAWQRHGDVRAGRGEDSRHVFQRFFGLHGPQIENLLGPRQQDTGFTQHGWHAKLAARLTARQSLTLRYQQSALEDVRGYKDLWGGLGRLRSDFAPQELRFFYARYEKLRLGWIDSLTSTFSLNGQRDGSVRQNLRATERLTTDDSVVNAFGYAAQATTHFGTRHALVFGGELYREQIRASRVETDPVTRTSMQRRALYPNGSRYTTRGLFAQQSAEWWQGRLRANAGGRFTRVSFQTFAARNRTTTGASLGVTDEAGSFQDVTFNTSLSWRVNGPVNVHALVGRGFRAPNLNDLGALGLNDLGYEIPASTAAQAGALLASSDGETALSTGQRVEALRAERLFNYEVGLTWQTRRWYARVQVFDAELKQPIVRRTLLFPANQAPAALAGLTVQPLAPTADQRAQSVITVAKALDPRAVKAFVNEGAAKYYGLESLFRYAVAARWALEGNYSWLAGRELNPNRFIRRLPPQQGFLALRYDPAWWNGRLGWLELSGAMVGAQERLSGGDLTDERIGAARRRSDIADFFRSARVRPFLSAGADGLFDTADDLFRPTGETLAQLQQRVLPLGAVVNGVRIVDNSSRAPLYLKTAGYATLNLRGGLRLSERAGLDWALLNLLDKNFRVHGSGLDAPGRNAYLSLRYTF